MKLDDLKKNDKSIISSLSIKTSEEYEQYNKILFAAKQIGINNENIIKQAFFDYRNNKTKLSTDVDYYNHIYKVALNNNFKIKKIAYPNNSQDRIIRLYDKEYDLAKWSEIVKQIYNKFYENPENSNFSIIVDDICEKRFNDDEERFKFKKWLKYYNEGNHKKYSFTEESNMRKQSSFYLPLTVDAYSGDSSPYASGVEMSSFDKTVDDARDAASVKTSYKDWKKKFTTAWRRIDKILKESEDFIEPEKYEQISEIMHKLDVQIGKIRFKSTASDISLSTAQSLKKIGFSEGADILTKFAQEAAQPLDTDVAQAPAPELQPATQGGQGSVMTGAGTGQAATPAVDTKTLEEASAERRAIERNNEATGEKVLEGIAPIPGPSANEYDKILSGTVNVDDASKKLEQIAGMLSDRRVIRYLAEFDIILDKLGIASMFPELAEAQSKLIDSYSYGLVRVTKMLGMLSNNRALFDRSTGDGQPDTSQPSASGTPTQQVSEPEVE